jgi:hypothetical protein
VVPEERDTGTARPSPIEEDGAADLLANVTFEIVDLPGAVLGRTVGTSLIQVDHNAAGHGWFVDSTPWDDAEFTRLAAADELVARHDGPAIDRADLLTAVMHEFGHLLGNGHDDAGRMQDSLPIGARRIGQLGSPPDAVDAVFAGIEAGLRGQ